MSRGCCRARGAASLDHGTRTNAAYRVVRASNRGVDRARWCKPAPTVRQQPAPRIVWLELRRARRDRFAYRMPRGRPAHGGHTARGRIRGAASGRRGSSALPRPERIGAMVGTPLARIAAGGTLRRRARARPGLWYQLFRRPLPKTSGRLHLRGLEAPVDVLRDRFGVPHVRARSAARPCFALGFCHGQDRLWQLEFFRRATAGRLSEFAGADALPADRLMRTLGMRRVAEREARELSAAPARALRAPTRPASTPRSTPRARCRSSSSSCASSPSRGTRVDLLAAVEADGVRALDQLGDGAAARRARARMPAPSGPRGSSRSTRAATRSSSTPGDALRGRGQRPRRADRARARGARPRDARHRLEQLGRLRRALGDRQAAARLRPAPDHHDPGPLVRGRPRLRRLPRPRRHAAHQPVPGVRADRARAPGASRT